LTVKKLRINDGWRSNCCADTATPTAAVLHLPGAAVHENPSNSKHAQVAGIAYIALTRPSSNMRLWQHVHIRLSNTTAQGVVASSFVHAAAGVAWLHVATAESTIAVVQPYVQNLCYVYCAKVAIQLFVCSLSLCLLRKSSHPALCLFAFAMFTAQK
jgi:hypothetical protein